MNKAELVQYTSTVRAGWEAAIAALGARGLERPNACGDWRVRDVLAHCNGWDRWQMVQLRCAFSGEIPTEAELLGGIVYPPNDNMHEDAMNAMFTAGAGVLPVEEIVRHWREVFDMREAWLAGATQEQLDEMIGADWAGGSPRIMRLAREVPGIGETRPVWQFLLDQVEHQDDHLKRVWQWMERQA
jgi:hypothetical protein